MKQVSGKNRALVLVRVGVPLGFGWFSVWRWIGGRARAYVDNSAWTVLRVGVRFGLE